MNDLVILSPSNPSVLEPARYVTALPSICCVIATSPKKIVPAGFSNCFTTERYWLIVFPTLITYECV